MKFSVHVCVYREYLMMMMMMIMMIIMIMIMIMMMMMMMDDRYVPLYYLCIPLCHTYTMLHSLEATYNCRVRAVSTSKY